MSTYLRTTVYIRSRNTLQFPVLPITVRIVAIFLCRHNRETRLVMFVEINFDLLKLFAATLWCSVEWLSRKSVEMITICNGDQREPCPVFEERKVSFGILQWPKRMVKSCLPLLVLFRVNLYTWRNTLSIFDNERQKASF